MDLDLNLDFTFDDLLNKLLEAESPPAPSPAELVVPLPPDHSHTGQHGGWPSAGPAPPVTQLLSPAALNSSESTQQGDAGTFSLGQQSTQWPAYSAPAPADVVPPAAPVIPNSQVQWSAYSGPSSAGVMILPAPNLSNGVPAVGLPPPLSSGPQPAGSLLYRNGETAYAAPPAAPQTNANNPKKRKPDDREQLHVKKPLNAFMLFLREQRSLMTAQTNGSGSAGINKFLGERWKSLSVQQKAKYSEQAKREAELHAQRHPEFSCSHNYGKRRKRIRAPTKNKYPLQQSKDMLVWFADPCPTPLPGPVMESPYFPGPVMESPYFPGPVIDGSYFPGPVMQTPYFPRTVMETPCFSRPLVETPHLPGQMMETHLTGPMIQTPHLTGPMMQTPHLTGPLMQNPHIAGPIMQTPLHQQPIIETSHLLGPLMETPHLSSPGVESHHLSGPLMETPHLPGPVAESAHLSGPLMDTPHLPGPVVESHQLSGPGMESTHLSGPVIESPYLPGPAVEGHHLSGPVVDGHHPSGTAVETPHLPGPVMETTHQPDLLSIHGDSIDFVMSVLESVD